MVDLVKTCPRFELIDRKTIEIDGSPAQQLDFKWRAPDGSTVQQRQAIVLVESGVAAHSHGNRRAEAIRRARGQFPECDRELANPPVGKLCPLLKRKASRTID